MNQRIQELALQAGYLPDMFGFGHWDMLECKKLIDLIVEECIAQCQTVSELEHKGYVISECSKRIRKHFGVEK